MTTPATRQELEELERQASHHVGQIQTKLSIKFMLREIFETIAFILLVFFIMRAILQNYVIDGSSMEPNFHNKQFIWVSKITYYHIDLNLPLRLLPGKSEIPRRYIYPFNRPNRGDVVIFNRPNGDDRLIKRVIGLPGDHVQVKDEKVYLNGALFEEEYIPSQTHCTGASENCDIVVPDYHVFVLGDNRPNSSDSRVFGPVPFELIIGRAWLIYWPRDEWGIINIPKYAIDAPKNKE